MHPGHYYGQLSFGRYKLHVGNGLMTEINKDGLVLEQNAIPTTPAQEMRLQERKISPRISKNIAKIEMKVEKHVDFNFKIVTRIVRDHDSSGSETYEYAVDISISKEAFQNINLTNRKLENVYHQEIGYYNNKRNISGDEEEESIKATLSDKVDFSNLLESIQDGIVKTYLKSILDNFVTQFLPHLQEVSKHSLVYSLSANFPIMYSEKIIVNNTILKTTFIKT
jgi:hypothetical protein